MSMKNDIIYSKDINGKTKEYMILGNNIYETQKNCNCKLGSLSGLISTLMLLGVLYYACITFGLI